MGGLGWGGGGSVTHVFWRLGFAYACSVEEEAHGVHLDPLALAEGSHELFERGRLLALRTQSQGGVGGVAQGTPQAHPKASGAVAGERGEDGEGAAGMWGGRGGHLEEDLVAVLRHNLQVDRIKVLLLFLFVGHG